MGFAYTSDLSDEGLRRVVETAISACRVNEPDEHAGLPDGVPGAGLDDLVAADFDARSVEERVEMALELERLATTVLPEVRRTASAVYADERGRNELYTTRGVAAAFEATVAYGYVETIAERGEEMQAGMSFTYGRSATALDLPACGREAAERAAGLLGAERLPSRTVPVVFEPWAAASVGRHPRLEHQRRGGPEGPLAPRRPGRRGGGGELRHPRRRRPAPRRARLPPLGRRGGADPADRGDLRRRAALLPAQQLHRAARRLGEVDRQRRPRLLPEHPRARADQPRPPPRHRRPPRSCSPGWATASSSPTSTASTP